MDSGGEQGKSEALHLDSVNSSRLSIIAHAVCPSARTILVQVEGEPGPTQSVYLAPKWPGNVRLC